MGSQSIKCKFSLWGCYFRDDPNYWLQKLLRPLKETRQKDNYILSRILKYSSLLIPTVFILVLIIVKVTSSYLGMITGLRASGWLNIKWSPFWRVNLQPNFLKIFTWVFQSVGNIFGKYLFSYGYFYSFKFNYFFSFNQYFFCWRKVIACLF